jgi:uncharacterized membrane protein
MSNSTDTCVRFRRPPTPEERLEAERREFERKAKEKRIVLIASIVAVPTFALYLVLIGTVPSIGTITLAVVAVGVALFIGFNVVCMVLDGAPKVAKQIRGWIKTMTTKRSLYIAGLIAIALFAVYVWPTQWRQDNVRIGDRYVVIRTHRITGAVQQLSLSSGWRDVSR